ncbi:uncharacterized protein A4U43_C02F13460 [Asparagus officinalis]|uniref:Uncharacterized protein n=1 Tax=Asparagus officinalis TaxID=4686 RepID=A0A5P1FN26_ASPOF|nr:uncharacterized protein A4U43_C02F13460 [Asparagus officinalis]
MEITEKMSKAKDLEGLSTFNMRSLSVHLPQKRKGLSKYFSGKARSFATLSDAKCIDDLQKAELPEAKRRKYSNQPERKESSSGSCCRSPPGV